MDMFLVLNLAEGTTPSPTINNLHRLDTRMTSLHPTIHPSIDITEFMGGQSVAVMWLSCDHMMTHCVISFQHSFN